METWGVLLSILLAGMMVFQILLALGFPYGKAAWGGQHDEVLPKKLRIGSAFSAVFFAFAILVTLSKSEVIDLFPAGFQNGFMWFITVYFGIGILMNAVSRSKVERLWAPYVAIMFVLGLTLVI